MRIGFIVVTAHEEHVWHCRTMHREVNVTLWNRSYSASHNHIDRRSFFLDCMVFVMAIDIKEEEKERKRALRGELETHCRAANRW